MAELRIKEEDLEHDEVLHMPSRRAQPQMSQNYWNVAQKNSKRRKAIPRKHHALKSMATSSVTRHAQPGMSNHDNNHLPRPLEVRRLAEARMGMRPEWAGEEAPTSRWQENGALDRVQTELSWYKKENSELRQRLKDMLDIKELERTLRMTLKSFGVPVPESIPKNYICERCSHELSWQPSRHLERQSSVNGMESDGEGQMVTGGDVYADYDGINRAASAYQVDRESQLDNGMTKGPVADEVPQDYSGYTKASSPSHPREVELIADSGVFIDAEKLSTIAFRKGWSYTLLTRSLMPMIFSREEMVASCVRGERATGRGALTSPARPALNQAKVQAILEFVSHQFPDVQPYQITQTMNQKLVDVRGTIRKRKRNSRLAKCDTSEMVTEAGAV